MLWSILKIRWGCNPIAPPFPPPMLHCRSTPYSLIFMWAWIARVCVCACVCARVGVCVCASVCVCMHTHQHVKSLQAGINDKASHEMAEKVLVELGEFFQVQVSHFIYICFSLNTYLNRTTTWTAMVIQRSPVKSVQTLRTTNAVGLLYKHWTRPMLNREPY